MHVDSLDLYRDGERRKFIERAAEETLLDKDLLKRDLGKLLLALEQSQETAPQRPARATRQPPASRAARRAAALELLRAPDLLKRIAAAYDEAGHRGRGDQPAGRLPGLRLPQDGKAPRRHHPDHQRRRENAP